ncbi:MAG: hypothetical protein RB191_10395 [Terriglobia bacterium]|nr:hypothetical protein [Terriglobia bacterium]
MTVLGRHLRVQHVPLIANTHRNGNSLSAGPEPANLGLRMRPRGGRRGPFAGEWNEVKGLLKVKVGFEAKTMFERLR